MLRRTPFRSKLTPPRPARQYEGVSPNAPRAPALRVVPSATSMVVSIPKPVAVKPGKRTPTKAEREWMAAIVALGCIACHLDGVAPRPTAVHHLLRGGRRIGHLFSIGLCDPGHHQGGAQFGLVSRHPWRAHFEAKYGSEADLLAEVARRLAK